MAISRLAIVGAGTMGANIALNFSASGHEVLLHDSEPAQLRKALQTVRANAELLQQHRLLAGPIDPLVARIRPMEKFEDAVAAVDLVIEAVPEKLQLKRAIFTHLDRACAPHTVLASNSSTFVPSSMSGAFVNPDRRRRFLVMHYWNPAHLLPLVELVPHEDTLPSVVEDIRALLTQCGKTPVVVRKEIAGFIGNRLAFALQREAMSLVAKGVATPEDIDAVAKASFGRRIPVTGIFGTADFGGLDVYLEICRSIFRDLSNELGAPPGLSRLVAQGKLGVKSGAGWSEYTPTRISEMNHAMTAELVRHLQRDQTLRDGGQSAGPTS